MQDLNSLLDLLEAEYIEKVLQNNPVTLQVNQGKVQAIRYLKKDLQPLPK